MSVPSLITQSNKELARIKKEICCLINAFENLDVSLSGGSDCNSPLYTELCNIQPLLDGLGDIVTAVNEIEITAENIVLEAEQINLNTDTLETLIAATNTLLGTVVTNTLQDWNSTVEIACDRTCANTTSTLTPAGGSVSDLSDVNTIVLAGLTAAEYIQVANQLNKIQGGQNVYTQINTAAGNIKITKGQIFTYSYVGTTLTIELLGGTGSYLNCAGVAVNPSWGGTADPSYDLSITTIQFVTTTYTHTPIEIVKHFRSGVYQSIEYRKLDGTVHTVTGTLVKCPCETSNPQLDIITNLLTPTSYNNVTQYELGASDTLTIPASSVHSISYKIIDGTCDITIGADTFTYGENESDMEVATTLINQEYVFETALLSKVRIKTIS